MYVLLAGAMFAEWFNTTYSNCVRYYYYNKYVLMKIKDCSFVTTVYYYYVYILHMLLCELLEHKLKIDVKVRKQDTT